MASYGVLGLLQQSIILTDLAKDAEFAVFVTILALININSFRKVPYSVL
jgi:hypothetical protein